MTEDSSGTIIIRVQMKERDGFCLSSWRARLYQVNISKENNGQTGSKFYKARMFKAPAELSTSSQDLKWKSLPRRETERSSNMCGDFPHGKFTKSLAAAEKLGSRAELGKRLRS